MDGDWNEYPKCPCCGEQDQDWHDGIGPKNDGDQWHRTCGTCGSDYMVEMSVSVSFRTCLVMHETKEAQNSGN